MNEWQPVEIGRHAKIESGFAFKSSDWQETGTPVVKITTISEGRLSRDGLGYVDADIAKKAGRFALKDGDVLIAMTGASLGAMARVRQSDLPLLLNQRVGRVAATSGQLDETYLYYALSSGVGREQLVNLGHGSAQPNLSAGDFGLIRVPMPTLPKQKAIARVLSALDDKIESNLRQTNLILDLIATKFKLEESFSNERVSLSSLINLERGREPGRDLCREDGSGIPFIRVSNLRMERHRGLTLLDFDGPLARPQDILISFDGTPGRVSFGLTGYFSSGVRRACLVDGEMPISLAWAILSGESVQSVIAEYSTGTTIQHAGSAVPHLTAPILSPSGQFWFQHTGEDLWKHLLNLRSSSETLFNLRNTLSPELLSGRCRVNEIE